MRGRNSVEPEVVTITPALAMELLECNSLNRPLNDQHVHRIARQIESGRWKFNGDTIKIATNKDILDGQHRLWACVESKKAIETIVVRGIDSSAFATIDTLRKPRSGADVLSLHGVTHHRVIISTSLQWLTRWQRGVLENYRAPVNRIENSDVEQAFRDNPGITKAAERASKLRGLTSAGTIAFFYFILNNRNPELAERMIFTLENPAGVSVNDPFFRLRTYMTNNSHKDPLTTIAIMVKAANAAYASKDVKTLNWRGQGHFAEEFPKLDVGHIDTKAR